MKLDHSEKVLDFEGKPIPQHEVDEATGTLRRSEDGSLYNKGDLTYRDLVISALNTPTPDEKIGAEEKARSYHLLMKFFASKTVKLTVDERAFIKKRAGVVLASPLAFGRLSDWLEGSDDGDKDDDEGSATNV